jgi:hypothetical protein
MIQDSVAASAEPDSELHLNLHSSKAATCLPQEYHMKTFRENFTIYVSIEQDYVVKVLGPVAVDATPYITTVTLWNSWASFDIVSLPSSPLLHAC